MSEFIIKAELAQAVLNYLITRPYMEVVQMIEGLRNLQPVNPPQQFPPTEVEQSYPVIN